MGSILKRFSERLKYLRVESKMTQEALANRSKLATGFISDLERGQKIPSLVTLDRLAHGLGIDVAELVRFSNNPMEGDRHQDDLILLIRILQKMSPLEIKRVRKVIESMHSS